MGWAVPGLQVFPSQRSTFTRRLKFVAHPAPRQTSSAFRVTDSHSSLVAPGGGAAGPGVLGTLAVGTVVWYRPVEVGHGNDEDIRGDGRPRPG